MPQTITQRYVREYHYEANGRLSRMVDFVGFDTGSVTEVTKNIEYNDLGLVSQIEYVQGQTQKENYTYTYNNRGFITNESVLNNYFSTPKDGTFAYSYDTIGRLTDSDYTDNMTSTTTNTDYTYDNVGNRLTKTKGGVTTTYTIGNYNQVASIATSGESTSFTYDGNGNTTK